MDAVTSVLALLCVGYAAGWIGLLLRLPRIVPMILMGIALYPVVHPSVLNTATFVSNPRLGGAAIDVSGKPVSGPNSAPFPAVNPASTIRTVALLIALARGGLSIRASYFKELGLTMGVLAVLPYALELTAEALIAPVVLPSDAGFGDAEPPWLAVFSCASIW